MVEPRRRRKVLAGRRRSPPARARRSALLSALAVLAAAGLACGGVEPPRALESEGSSASEPQSGRDGLEAGPGTAFSTSLEESAPAAASNPQPGCSKLDFLFVVDNSFSMEREQANLARSFPGFVQVIASTLRAEDFHVMVVDTDAIGPLEALAAEARPPETQSDLCDVTLGAGKRLDRHGNECGLRPGERFITADQPQLAAAFECIARVGTSGHADERPIGALLGATSSTSSSNQGCNADFLREDAVLVVTIMTDEDDTHTVGTPGVWRDRLLEAKHNDESAIVVLALVGDENLSGGLPGGPCEPEQAQGAPILQEFTQSFLHGSLGSVCAPEYTPFFARAVDVVSNACQRFVPPDIR